MNGSTTWNPAIFRIGAEYYNCLCSHSVPNVILWLNMQKLRAIFTILEIERLVEDKWQTKR